MGLSVMVKPRVVIDNDIIECECNQRNSLASNKGLSESYKACQCRH